jgi:hypothetical protein
MELNDKIVLDYVAPDGKLIAQRCSANALKKLNLYDYIINRYDNNTLTIDDKYYLRECLYRLVNNIETPPVCKTCGNTIKFSYTYYPIYCSRYCSNHDEEVLKKISESCSKSLRDAYKRDGDNIKLKRQNTLSARYGEDINSSSPFAVREIQELSQKIVEEKYGVKNSFQMEKCRKKRTETARNKSIQMQKERGIEIEYLDNGNYLVKNCCPIHGDLEYTQTDFNNRFRLDRYHVSNPCYLCNPFGNHISGQQKNIFDYIKSIYLGDIIENDKTVLDGLEIDIYLPELKIGFEFNGDYWHMNPLMYRYGDENSSSNVKAIDQWESDRKKILLANEKGVKLYHIWEYYFSNYKDLQLDFISNIILGNIEYEHPLLKLKKSLDKIDASYELKEHMIFEYENVRIVYVDGFYFNKNSISYDVLSSWKSETKRTIFVYDYEITDERKFEVIISDIKYALGKIENRIYARKCVLKELTNKDVRKFLEDNSLFGYRSASITLGLYYENELVMIYSLGNNFYGRKKDTEVIRVCTKKNTQVIGGSSKCLNYYIKNYAKSGETIIFYVDAIHHSGSSMSEFEYIKHENGFMNYYVSFDKLGKAFNRTPSRNKEVKELIEKGELVLIPTYGVDVYKKIIE